jgi:8-oxo-dGTP diphosphatase
MVLFGELRLSDFLLRTARQQDARGILEAHYSAVHRTSLAEYPQRVLAAWSPPIDSARLEAYLTQSFPHEVTIVAECRGSIVGFGAIEPKENLLKGLYVAAEYSRRGIGKALLCDLERIALEAGCRELKMDSSLTAFRFYSGHGYRITQLGNHELRDGVEMPCVRMRKVIAVEPEMPTGAAPDTKIKRVACAIVKYEGKVLLARRLPDDAQGGLWEFPGGKVDPGETEEACLHRELDEELGMKVDIERLFLRHRFPIRSGLLELAAFLCKMTTPAVRLEAHSELAWVKRQDIPLWDLMAADVAIGEALANAFEEST